jgi:hypothetical protein
MRRISNLTSVALIFVLASSVSTAWAQNSEDRISVFDGSNLDSFLLTGSANWHIVGDVVEATEGNGYLVVREPYANFVLTLEFWVASSVNSGVYIRCPAPEEHGGRICYEIQIHDERPEQIYRTGGIVRHRSPAEHVNSVGQWNSYEIRAEAEHITVTLNNVVTAEIANSDYLCDEPCAHRSDGYISLQYNDDSGGALKFRNIQILPIE